MSGPTIDLEQLERGILDEHDALYDLAGPDQAHNEAHASLRRLFLERMLQHPKILAVHERWAERNVGPAAIDIDADPAPGWRTEGRARARVMLSNTFGPRYVQLLEDAADDPGPGGWTERFREAEDLAREFGHPYPWFALEILRAFDWRQRLLRGLGYSVEDLESVAVPNVTFRPSAAWTGVFDAITLAWNDEPVSATRARVREAIAELRALDERLARVEGDGRLTRGSAAPWDDELLERYVDVVCRRIEGEEWMPIARAYPMDLDPDLDKARKRVKDWHASALKLLSIAGVSEGVGATF